MLTNTCKAKLKQNNLEDIFNIQLAIWVRLDPAPLNYDWVKSFLYSMLWAPRACQGKLLTWGKWFCSLSYKIYTNKPQIKQNVVADDIFNIRAIVAGLSEKGLEVKGPLYTTDLSVWCRRIAGNGCSLVSSCSGSGSLERCWDVCDTLPISHLLHLWTLPLTNIYIMVIWSSFLMYAGQL